MVICCNILLAESAFLRGVGVTFMKTESFTIPNFFRGALARSLLLNDDDMWRPRVDCMYDLASTAHEVTNSINVDTHETFMLAHAAFADPFSLVYPPLAPLTSRTCPLRVGNYSSTMAESLQGVYKVSTRYVRCISSLSTRSTAKPNTHPTDPIFTSIIHRHSLPPLPSAPATNPNPTTHPPHARKALT